MHFKLYSKIFLKLIMALVVSISFYPPLKAQPTRVINSIDEAVSLALENNSDVINAKLEILKAEKKVSEVYSDNLVPTLTLNSRFQRAIRKQTIDIFGQKFEIGTDNTLINTLDVTEPIPVLGTPVFSAIRIADYYSKIQDENLVFVSNNVRTNVRNAYYSVLLAKAVVEVNKLSLENSKDNFDVVESKYRNGVATEFDYLRAKVRVDNSIPILSKSEKDFEISRRILINAIGLKTVQDIEVRGELTYDSLEVWQSTDYMINKIAENYVAVRQLNINRDINKELIRVDKANYLPKLHLFGQYVLSSSENDEQQMLDWRFNNTLFVGMGLSWNLNLFRNSYKVDQSEIEVKKNDEQIADLKQKLRLSSESAIIAIDDAKERIITRKKTLSLAERSLELANASYRAGTIEQIDVQAAELSLSESRLAYQQVIYEYQIAKSELEKLLEK